MLIHQATRSKQLKWTDHDQPDTMKCSNMLKHSKCKAMHSKSENLTATALACTSHTLAAFRVLDAHNLRRGLPAPKPNHTLACISRTRHAQSPQRVGFWSFPVSLVPPWCFAGCPNGPFLLPWCLPGCPIGPFLPPHPHIHTSSPLALLYFLS